MPIIIFRLIGIGAPLILALVLFFLLGKKIGQLEAQKEYSAALKQNREDAVRRSRATLGGQLAEQVAPFLPGFPCNPADVRFVGKPIDFVAFPGAALGKKIEEIVFIEIKSGESKLSPREKEIRDAVANGRVRYLEYRVPC